MILFRVWVNCFRSTHFRNRAKQLLYSFFCISIYNSLKLISPLSVLLLSIFTKVETITLAFILTFFTSYLLVISFVFFIENIDSLLKTALKKNWYLSSKNVGKWVCSGKWNTDRGVLLWLRSTKDRLHCCIFSGISSFISWKYLYWNNCLQDKILEIFILATWIIAMVVRCPVLFFFKVLEHPDGLVCTPLWSPYFKHYTVAMIAVGFYVPLVLITILYLTIALTIKSQKTAGEQSVSRRGQRLKREKIVLKISIAIVSAFTMGWLPLSIWWLVYFYSSDKTVIWSGGFQYFTEIVRFFMYSYCAVNPCICLIFIGNYRQGLKNLLSSFTVAPP